MVHDLQDHCLACRSPYNFCLHFKITNWCARNVRLQKVVIQQKNSRYNVYLWDTFPNVLAKRKVSSHRFSCICDQFGTFESIRTGSIPKKGLIGIEGKISASGADGRGVIHIPPVSGKPHLFMNTFFHNWYNVIRNY